MEYRHVLSTSNSQTISERILGIFNEADGAREAGQFWSIDNGYASDLSWYKVGYNLETVQVSQFQWLHIKTIKANCLIE